MSQKEPVRAASCQDVPELLPFYWNRSLGKEEARRVEAHLATCPACRRAERETRTAAALMGGHLPVEELVDYATARPTSAPRREVIESHLATCEACAEEVATVRGEGASAEEPAGGEVLEAVFPRRATTLRESARGLRNLALAACFATVVASGGWIWTWWQLAGERATIAALSPRANVPVLELLPASGPLLRNGGAAPGEVNRLRLAPSSGEIVLVLLAGGGSCASGCTLDVLVDGEADPERRVEGLLASPDGHLTVSLPASWLVSGSVLAVRDPASGERVAAYAVEVDDGGD